MSIKISIPVVEAAYELLRTTAPFKAWKLPRADEISFKLTGSKTDKGSCHVSAGREMYLLEVSQVCHHTLDELLKTLAHEMCHLREFQLNVRKDVMHGKDFNRLADNVCRVHQYDRGMF